MIASTKKTKLEHAYSICMPKDGIDFIIGECSGTKCSVSPVYCPDEIPRSFNHTHPGPGQNLNHFSIADMASGLAVKSPFDCLYSINDKRGLCITYRQDLSEDEKQKVQECRAVERQIKKRKTEAGWKKLDKCYQQIPQIVGQSFCEYGLKQRAKKIDYKGRIAVKLQ